MDKNTAARLIQDVFQNPFNRDRFVTFTKNLFNYLDTEKNFIYRGNFIPDAYKPYINTLERIGKYEDAEGNKIDVLIVHLKKEHSIEHARTMQRNFIAWYLGGSRGGELKDAALVSFYTDNPDDWRFSLVKMDYKIVESSTGKIKTKTELTPARRFSFLVGKNENSHTAQRQLLPTLQDDKNNPLLSDLEKAFNIEVVTQEFFEKYKSLFLDVKDALERIIKKDNDIAKDFADKGVDPVDFSKKLLGQIVFLYFLQKKGWFGVERDSDWGTGPKNFLRLLFEKKIANYKNFFNDILEPLFYEALAKERDDDFYSRFNCKIPFLNGGLFDPLCDYDWVHTDILLPDDLFSNHVRTKEGDIGTGILDIFDRYNFTVKEDEPLEKEVAVDPEMLGKVFENLLEVKDRKSKGTYYTPREIVHYMCQESLINYLVNELNSSSNEDTSEAPKGRGGAAEGGRLLRGESVSRKDIENLIQYGETAVEHDSRVEQEGKETETYSYKLPESVRKNAQLLDDKLKNIRVCDPAIGSGAFPVGMMNEIIRTRNTLTNYLEDKKDRSIYNFKRDAIQNSLYGVDIDPGAVEIAKLRLWLSLVVDEQDIKQIKPLPNLDYKIMQGNSLLEVEKEKMGMRDMFYEQKMQELKEKKQFLFNETSAGKKHEYKEQIDEIIGQLTNGHKDFDFEIYFSEVFENKNEVGSSGNRGFDVVIANPPYISSWNMGGGNKKYYLKKYKSATGHFDMYVLFLEKGLHLLKDNGILTFITSNKYLSQGYGLGIRQLFLQNKIIAIINFNFHVFKATVDSCITIVQKSFDNHNSIKIMDFNDSDLINKNLENLLASPKRITTISQSTFDNLDSKNFRINLNEKKLTLINKIKKSSNKIEDFYFVTRSISVHSSKLGFKKEHYVYDKSLNDNFKKYIEAENFTKWRINSFKFIDYRPLEHHRPNFSELFEVKGLMCKRTISSGLCFILNDKKFYCNDGVTTSVRWVDLQSVKNNQLKQYKLNEKSELVKFSSQINNKFMLALLNSRLIEWYFYEYYSDKLHFYPEHLRNLPIKLADRSFQTIFVEIVDKILAITNSSDYITNSEKQAKIRDYEKQIDQLVYKLYGLTQEEVNVIQSYGHKQ